MNSLLGKIFGWVQFGLTAGQQVFGSGSIHGWQGWLVSISSLAAAVGIHAAANVGQATDNSGATTVSAQSVVHVKQ